MNYIAASLVFVIGVVHQTTQRDTSSLFGIVNERCERYERAPLEAGTVHRKTGRERVVAMATVSSTLMFTRNTGYSF